VRPEVERLGRLAEAYRQAVRTEFRQWTDAIELTLSQEQWTGDELLYMRFCKGYRPPRPI